MINWEKDHWNIKAFCTIFIAIVALSAVLLVSLERQDKINELNDVQVKEQWAVQMEYSLMAGRITSLVSDVAYLHDVYEDQLASPDQYDAIARQWIVFSNKRHIYDQLRFIDAKGDEKIRVDLREGGAIQIPRQELQNKKDRYYFYEAARLPKGTLHISPLDLNIEQDAVEIPYKPMIRLSMPIHSHDGRVLGVIVVNYLADDFLDLFRQYDQTTRGHIVLLNGAGYYLSSYRPELTWGFMFPDGKENRFAQHHPNEWAAILQNNAQMVTNNGLYTALPIDLHELFLQKNLSFLPHTIYSTDMWYIVSWVPKDADNDFLYYDDYGHLFLQTAAKLIFLVMILLALIVAAIGSQIIRNYQQVHYRAEYDPLTHAYSRQAGMTKLQTLYSDAKSMPDLVYSICFIDVNGLKEINDTLGHKHGDDLIRTAIESIRKEIRQYDYVIRVGGDEFIIVLPNAATPQTELAWDRIRNRINGINTTEQRPYFISLSHGIVDNHSDANLTLDEMVSLADERMYEEKQVLKQGFSSLRT